MPRCGLGREIGGSGKAQPLLPTPLSARRLERNDHKVASSWKHSHTVLIVSCRLSSCLIHRSSPSPYLLQFNTCSVMTIMTSFTAEKDIPDLSGKVILVTGGTQPRTHL